jgi:hypothetical protein
VPEVLRLVVAVPEELRLVVAVPEELRLEEELLLPVRLF